MPLVITSLGAAQHVTQAVHGYGGIVFHDVITLHHAEKAAKAGVDGIVAVTTGAGGHGGTLSPFAMLAELRRIFDGTIILAGSITNGAQVLAAKAMGADLASLGTRFIATTESLAPHAYKQMLLRAKADDIIYTSAVSGTAANFLRESLEAAGLDLDKLSQPQQSKSGDLVEAWTKIWSAGQGVGTIDDILGTAELCERLFQEYHQAGKQLLIDELY